MEEAWTVRGVYLLTSGVDGQVAVPQLALTLLPEGIELDKPDGEIVWSCTWPELREMSPVERSVLPDGRDGVVVELVEKGRRGRHRFVLPTDDPVSLEELLRRRARAHGLHSASPHTPPVSARLTAVIALAAIATLTVLLLSAAHVFRF
jgi:hypothetical protein